MLSRKYVDSCSMSDSTHTYTPHYVSSLCPCIPMQFNMIVRKFFMTQPTSIHTFFLEERALLVLFSFTLHKTVQEMFDSSHILVLVFFHIYAFVNVYVCVWERKRFSANTTCWCYNGLLASCHHWFSLFFTTEPNTHLYNLAMPQQMHLSEAEERKCSCNQSYRM